MDVPSFPRKRRRRNTLDVNAHALKYENNTLTTSFECQEAFKKSIEIFRCDSRKGS